MVVRDWKDWMSSVLKVVQDENRGASGERTERRETK
jgi:hypothetical protein